MEYGLSENFVFPETDLPYDPHPVLITTHFVQMSYHDPFFQKLNLDPIDPPGLNCAIPGAKQISEVLSKTQFPVKKSDEIHTGNNVRKYFFPCYDWHAS